jgi:hypothetical protein
VVYLRIGSDLPSPKLPALIASASVGTLSLARHAQREPEADGARSMLLISLITGISHTSAMSGPPAGEDSRP